jgi:hypothetical protein
MRVDVEVTEIRRQAMREKSSEHAESQRKINTDKRKKKEGKAKKKAHRVEERKN